MKLIREHRMTHEMVTNEWKGSPEVWEALLESMPMTAMIRNLGKMSNVGLLKPLGKASKSIVDRLGDREALKKARIHPISLLSALRIYQQGHGERGKLSWKPIAQICDALDEAFYLAFDVIEPTGKRILLALDVSGSMTCGLIAGVPGLTPRVASAAMAMATIRSEKNWHCVGFTSSVSGYGGMWGGGSSGLTPVDISAKMQLDTVCRNVQKLPMGGTDCALPMQWALKNNIEVDSFVVYTDNETWAGAVHPFQALREYRKKMGIPAKLVVVGMTATEFTIADPNDAGMMDVVGFDSSAPSVMADFIR